MLVFISIGFSLGKEATRRSVSKKIQPPLTAPQVATQGEEQKIVVYYMHTTFRCVTCNQIEKMTRTLVETEFGEALKDGRLEFKEVNFQKDEELAKRYNVGTGCVIVAKIANGKDIEFEMLQDVWTLYSEPSKFNEYLSSAIRSYLEEVKK